MGKSYELPVVYGVFTKSAYADAHTVFKIHIQSYLGTIVLFQILDELLRCAGKCKLLGKSLEVYQLLD